VGEARLVSCGPLVLDRRSRCTRQISNPHDLAAGGAGRRGRALIGRRPRATVAPAPQGASGLNRETIRRRRSSRAPASAATAIAPRSGGLSLQSFDVQTAGEHSETAEKMIRKLRAGQMPPPGSRRPTKRRSRHSPTSSSSGSTRTRRARFPAAAPSSASTAPSTPARSAISWRSTSTPATTCRSTRRAPTSTTSPTRSCCRRR
jgi:hypothetical protein